jgi:hypothetical protein
LPPTTSQPWETANYFPDGNFIFQICIGVGTPNNETKIYISLFFTYKYIFLLLEKYRYNYKTVFATTTAALACQVSPLIMIFLVQEPSKKRKDLVKATTGPGGTVTVTRQTLRQNLMSNRKEALNQTVSLTMSLGYFICAVVLFLTTMCPPVIANVTYLCSGTNACTAVSQNVHIDSNKILNGVSQ